VGKDQVTRAVQYNAHARKLRLQAKALMNDALSHLKTSELDEKRCVSPPQLRVSDTTPALTNRSIIITAAALDIAQVQHQP
jgi:hypothetical protein